MISTKPTTELTKLVNLPKRHIIQIYQGKEFEKIYVYDSFWSDSYYLATQVSVVIYKYIDNQRKKRKYNNSLCTRHINTEYT